MEGGSQPNGRNPLAVKTSSISKCRRPWL
jgi:hypothetical protein